MGPHGLLGHAFHGHLARDERFTVTELGRGEMNLANPATFERILDAVAFDVLVNCAGYTSVDDCEIQGDLAYLVNGHAPGMLARIAARRRVRMIQFSTDYVFDGRQLEPYTEADAPNPLSVYGKSKLLGEQLVLEAAPQHLVVRLSWLFGPGRAAFPDWIISKASKLERVEVVADKTGCPTSSEDAAEAMLPWLEDAALPGGLLHFCNPPPCAWSDYGQRVLDLAAKAGVPLRTHQVTPISIAALPGLTALRPPHSALAIGRYRELSGREPRSWPEALGDFILNRYGTASS